PRTALRGTAGGTAPAGTAPPCVPRTGPSDRPPSLVRSLEEAHPAAYLGHGAAREGAGLGRAGPQQVRDPTRLRLEPLCPLADGGERGYHIVRQHPLAVETAPSCGAAVVRHQRERGRRREALVNGEDVADVGVARVLPRDPCRIGGRGFELFPDGLRRVEQRSEERRVGKECRSEGGVGHGNELMREARIVLVWW